MCILHVLEWILIMILILLGIGVLLAVIFVIILVNFLSKDSDEGRPYCLLLEDDCIHESCGVLCNACPVWKDHNEKEQEDK